MINVGDTYEYTTWTGDKEIGIIDSIEDGIITIVYSPWDDKFRLSLSALEVLERENKIKWVSRKTVSS